MSFKEHDTMLVLTIPDVVVQKLVDVRLELTTIRVHVSHEELYDEPSITLPA